MFLKVTQTYNINTTEEQNIMIKKKYTDPIKKEKQYTQ